MHKMRAAVINRFGNENELIVDNVPMPQINNDQVLIKVAYAGIGSWDVFEREGGYAQMLGVTPSFPYIFGSEGSGEIVEIGANVARFRIGDMVCASGFLNPKGGFYAEYTAVDASTVAHLPKGYSLAEASAFLGVGLTALRGIADVLALKPNESVCIFGASGGVGHIAVQIARSLNARVCAIASGDDGTNFVRKLGVTNVFDGYDKNLLKKIQSSGLLPFDKVLLTAGGGTAEQICQEVKHGGKIAYPSGIYPEPINRELNNPERFYGDPDSNIIERLIEEVEKYRIIPNIDRVFSIEESSSAHKFINKHYIGKTTFKIS